MILAATHAPLGLIDAKELRLDANELRRDANLANAGAA
jgi:hypothetical protein